MAVVNRYSQYVPYQYNPGTLQEMLAVPMYMRQQHDAADQEYAQQRALLGQVDTDPMHDELVNPLIDEYNRELEDSVESLMKEGFNSKTRSRLSNLNANLQRDLGSKGDIGRSMAYRQSRAAALEDLQKRYPEYGDEALNRALNEQYQQDAVRFGLTGEVGSFTPPNVAPYVDLNEDIESVRKDLGSDTIDEINRNGWRIESIGGIPALVDANGMRVKTNNRQIQTAISNLQGRWFDTSGKGYRSNLTQGMDQNHIIQQINTGLGLRSEVSQTFPGERIRFIPERSKDNTVIDRPKSRNSKYTIDAVSAMGANNPTQARNNAEEGLMSNDISTVNMSRQYLNLYNDLDKEFESTLQDHHLQARNAIKSYADQNGYEVEDLLNLYGLLNSSLLTVSGTGNATLDRFNREARGGKDAKTLDYRELYENFTDGNKSIGEDFLDFKSNFKPLYDNYIQVAKDKDKFMDEAIKERGFQADVFNVQMSRSESKELAHSFISGLSENVRPLTARGRRDSKGKNTFESFNMDDQDTLHALISTAGDGNIKSINISPIVMNAGGKVGLNVQYTVPENKQIGKYKEGDTVEFVMPVDSIYDGPDFHTPEGMALEALKEYSPRLYNALSNQVETSSLPYATSDESQVGNYSGYNINHVLNNVSSNTNLDFLKENYDSANTEYLIPFKFNINDEASTLYNPRPEDINKSELLWSDLKIDKDLKPFVQANKSDKVILDSFINYLNRKEIKNNESFIIRDKSTKEAFDYSNIGDYINDKVGSGDIWDLLQYMVDNNIPVVLKDRDEFNKLEKSILQTTHK